MKNLEDLWGEKLTNILIERNRDFLPYENEILADEVKFVLEHSPWVSADTAGMIKSRLQLLGTTLTRRTAIMPRLSIVPASAGMTRVLRPVI